MFFTVSEEPSELKLQNRIDAWQLSGRRIRRLPDERVDVDAVRCIPMSQKVVTRSERSGGAPVAVWEKHPFALKHLLEVYPSPEMQMRRSETLCFDVAVSESLAVGVSADKILHWKLDSSNRNVAPLASAFDLAIPPEYELTQAAISSDGKRITCVLGGIGENTFNWRVVTYEQTATRDGALTYSETKRFGDRERFTLTVRPDNHSDRLLVHDRGGPIWVANLAGQKVVELIDENADLDEFGKLPMEWGRNGQLCAVGSGNGGLRLFETKSWTLTDEVNSFDESITACSFSRSGKYLAMGLSTGTTQIAIIAEDGTVKAYPATVNGQRAHLGPVTAITWSNDDSCMFTVGADRTAVVWDSPLTIAN
jgi:WD40 repeat protein